MVISRIWSAATRRSFRIFAISISSVQKISKRQQVAALQIALLTWLWLALPVLAGDWPQWRGPAGTGVCDERNLPVFWNEGRSIAWKCELPQWGTSTPAIWGNAIFLTSHTKDNELQIVRINKTSGKIEWTRDVGSGEAVRKTPEKRGQQKFHDLQNLASPSPVTDGKTVVVHFGNGDLAAYDFDGQQLWKRNLQDDYGAYTIWWGHANSPVLHGGLVISACMQDSLADLRDKPVESYLVAHDLRTGKERWKVVRTTKAKSEECDAYTTPVLVRRGERQELIVMGGNQLDAYDPATGKQLWYLEGLVGGRTVTGPVVADDCVLATRGMKKELVCVKPTHDGELSARDVAWEAKAGTPDTCCPVVSNGLVFTITDDGIAKCYDLPTGHVQWTERLKGNYKASPIAAEARVYFLSTDGLCTVVSASSRFDKLTENKLDDEFIASPAASDGKLYLRGKKSLYCISRD
jgi:outer membrane protein assembly factor BamB